jgi:hypothetical protein
MKKTIGFCIAVVAALAFGTALADDSKAPDATEQQQASTDTADKTDKADSAGAASGEPLQSSYQNTDIQYNDEG